MRARRLEEKREEQRIINEAVLKREEGLLDIMEELSLILEKDIREEWSETCTVLLRNSVRRLELDFEVSLISLQLSEMDFCEGT
jgi:hypothetical protein